MSSADSENVVKLLGYLFHQNFCPEQSISQEQKPYVLPPYFFSWLEDKRPLLDQPTLAESVGVPVETWDTVWEIIESGLASQRLVSFWHYLTLSDRPDPKHKLKSIVTNMLLTFEDGTIHTVQSFTTCEMLTNKDGAPPFNDALVAMLISKAFPAFIEDLLKQGVDGLHAAAKNFRGDTPEDPFEVLMGLWRKFEAQLRPDIRPLVERYARLVQGLIRPVVPLEVQAQIAALKRQHAAQAPAGPQQGARGGWDEDDGD